MKKTVFLFVVIASLVLSACAPTAPTATAIPAEPEASTSTFVQPADATPDAAKPTEAAVPTQQTVSPAASGDPLTLTILTHDSFSASEGVIAAFEQKNNVKLSFIKGGDAGATLNRAILSKDSPLADVIYGVDNTFLSRAETGDVLESYVSPNLADIPDELKLSKGNLLTPVDYGDVCINYDKAYFAD